MLSPALAHDLTTQAGADAVLAAFDRDAARFPGRPFLWPLMIGDWKRKDRE